MEIIQTNSDKARLADVRIRIVRDDDPEEPCECMDLVFEKTKDESLIPSDAIHSWKFDCNHEHEPIWFFTTKDRCEKMICSDPNYWTKEKLIGFEKDEKNLYQQWDDGNVFGYIIESWNAEQREWNHKDSCFGYYGLSELLSAIKDYLDERKISENDIVICSDESDICMDLIYIKEYQ
jgi:hypothetical protein